jgi:hypothetical protein
LGRNWGDGHRTRDLPLDRWMLYQTELPPNNRPQVPLRVGSNRIPPASGSDRLFIAFGGFLSPFVDDTAAKSEVFSPQRRVDQAYLDHLTGGVLPF